MSGPVYALNLFNVADRDEYLAYSRRSAKEVHAHGGRVVALGKLREAAVGDIKPRTVMILVEWTSMWTANRHESQWRFLRLPLKGAISPP